MPEQRRAGKRQARGTGRLRVGMMCSIGMREAIRAAAGGIHRLVCHHAWVERWEIREGVLVVSPEYWFPAQEALHGMGVEEVYWEEHDAMSG